MPLNLLSLLLDISQFSRWKFEWQWPFHSDTGQLLEGISHLEQFCILKRRGDKGYTVSGLC